MLAGSVEATCSGHKIIGEFQGDKLLLRIPKFRSVWKLRRANFPGAELLLKAIAANNVTIYYQIGFLKSARFFPEPSSLVRFLLPWIDGKSK